MSLRQNAPGWSKQISRDLPHLFSMLAFIGLTALIFRSWEFALIVTASLGFHELGHACALIWYRLEWRIHFGLIGAWTWSSAEERARLSELSNTYIHLAGPFFSLMLAMTALTIHHLWLPADRHLLILANFSAQVGFLNLLPLGPITDGGKIIQRMIASLEPHRRKRIIWLPIGVALLLLVLNGLVQVPIRRAGESLPFLAELLLIGLWMTGSMILETRSARKRLQESQSASTGGELIPRTGAALITPPEQPHPMNVAQGMNVVQGMNVAQGSFLTLLVWDMLALYVVVISSTPFWLEPAYVRGSLMNILDILHWIFYWI